MVFLFVDWCGFKSYVRFFISLLKKIQAVVSIIDHRRGRMSTTTDDVRWTSSSLGCRRLPWIGPVLVSDLWSGMESGGCVWIDWDTCLCIPTIRHANSGDHSQGGSQVGSKDAGCSRDCHVQGSHRCQAQSFG